MEKPAEGAVVVIGTNSGDIPTPERPPVRRRLVQSTLFPHKLQESVKESMVKEGEDCEEDGNHYDEGECCGSQRKKGKRKPKAVTQSSAYTKVAPNFKETMSRSKDDRDSAITVEYQRQREQQEGQIYVGSLEENDNMSSPPESASNKTTPRHVKRRANTAPEKRRVNTTPEKRRVNTAPEKQRENTTPKKRRVSTTPRRNIMSSFLKEACSSQISTNPKNSEHTPQSIPNLRLEAKLTAEENSRLFAGRQIHPFFSSWKIGKRDQETTVESNRCSIEIKNKNTTFGPIHVFEKAQYEAVSLDWKNWIFSEGRFISANSDLESACSSVFEGSVKPLKCDNFLSFIHPTGSLPVPNGIDLDKCSIQKEMASLDQPCNQQEHLHMKLAKEVDKADFFYEYAGHVGNSSTEWQDRFLQESMMPYYHGCNNQPENSMWTRKYQPEKAIEVCGNGESVKFLSEWLCLWHERGYQTNKGSIIGDNLTMQDAEFNCYQSDCDSESMDEDIGLKNVLLVTGPVGSGKSAAIYACAKEQGFQVIEVNASDWRNGALVKQRFKEAVESHWLRRTPENAASSEGKLPLKSSPVIPNSKMVQEYKDEVIELIPQNAGGIFGKSLRKENRTASDQNKIKTLILFEDVDAILYEDRGFIAAIQQLAETAKRPMILTSNSKKPALPNKLDRLEVSFTIPSWKELLGHVHRVCVAEKATIPPSLLERFIRYCQGDVRKTIMHVQFWCQGQRFRRDENPRSRYDPLLFDIDAGHQIVEKIIPWDHPCQLSELVDKEISKPSLLVEENSSLMEIDEQGELNHNEMQNSPKMINSEMDNIEAKKEAILRRHCPVEDSKEFSAHVDFTCELSTSSGSPVAFTRRKIRRKPVAVLSSNSGDECCSYGFPLVPGILSEHINNEILEVNRKPSSHCLATDSCFHTLSEQLLHSEAQKLEENDYHCLETADNSQINGTCKSLDFSFVPESSFVPETELNNNGMELLSGTVSRGYTVEETVSSRGLMPNMVPIDVNCLNKSFTGFQKHLEIKGHTNYSQPESSNVEEMGDSYIDDAEAVAGGYQGMDECSRMDFSRGTNFSGKPWSGPSGIVTDSVQETWKKLRVCHTDLRQYVTPELKDALQLMKLASRTSDLISEADLLTSDCQPLTCGHLGPSELQFENEHPFNRDDQLHMASTISQHGICFYAKEIAAAGSKMGYSSRVDLAREMLVSSTNTMALGKLIHQDGGTVRNSEIGPPRRGILLKSELKSSLCNLVESIVPSRLHLTLKADAFHEYLASLGMISRLEATRLSKTHEKTKRRVRVAPHYLSAGSAMLSTEDILLLEKCNCYQKVPSRTADVSLR